MADEALREVRVRGERDCPPDGGQSAVLSGYPFDETVLRLKGAIDAEDLWVVAEIDPQMLLRRGGYAIPPVRQILYFHPRYMSRLLAANAAAIVEAPLKFVVMASPSGGVIVRYPEPGTVLAKHEGMKELGHELGDAARRIAATVSAVGEPPIC